MCCCTIVHVEVSQRQTHMFNELADSILSADCILSVVLIIIHQRHRMCLQNKQNQMMQRK